MLVAEVERNLVSTMLVTQGLNFKCVEFSFVTRVIFFIVLKRNLKKRVRLIIVKNLLALLCSLNKRKSY